ncbi:MAG: gamma-glutamyltransferase [Chloroflexi bacterium GWB2_49_20]|nr:MAG: gamma-glutamyltransferase [Chloroflexi bacterium GWB2_49_20]OGN79608.1 MAG: gamma-glutamyltransferase [Chloroflexi bacterium GWC2_49_37]OGN84469.1 MAG: gamma-glutamyltransferase [Chloroflexi bacterium GWD2_49_16]HBG74109.1 gamma-glutamyltransferase [Anaerolineae bacterium]HCC78911.1 gamma-glutamyltransferase [Anaerolineae bacterium]
MNDILKFSSRRSPVMGSGGMVAASQPLAAAAGLEILKLGGTAADAAVATAAALNVTEPTSTGIGGDCFALYYEANTGQISALNGSGRAPAELSLERLGKEGLGTELPPFHPYTITVPGACAGWFDLLESFGSLPMAEILNPAIRLAEGGFPVAPLTSYFWQRGAQRQLASALNGNQMTIEGRGPNPGEVFKNPGLARTFKLIAEKGKAVFYKEEIGEAIVNTIHQAGGCMSMADLANHLSTWEDPISTSFRGLRLWECPPNGQGLAALLALNIIEGFDLEGFDPISPVRLHLEIEAMRLAFADTRWYLADPVFSEVPVHELLSKDYANDRRKLIDPNHAKIDQQYGVPVASTDTVYFCVVDKFGNACSFINSNYMGFGTGIVPSGWGFTLHNRGHNFNLEKGHPNVLAPGKRPYHTIIPAMVTRESDHSLYAALGVMGGFMQPQGHLQIFLALASDHLDPQACLDLPRFCIEDGTAGGGVALEKGIPPRVVANLRARGHTIRVVSGNERALFGRGQIIQRDNLSGVLCAGSDARADGCAMTLV